MVESSSLKTLYSLGIKVVIADDLKPLSVILASRDVSRVMSWKIQQYHVHCKQEAQLLQKNRAMHVVTYEQTPKVDQMSRNNCTHCLEIFHFTLFHFFFYFDIE